MKRGKIIIAEDDPVLRGIYQKKFSVNGYQIRTAADGEEALEMIENDEPDLLILDINMPVIDGFAVMEKHPKEQRRFPVILLTNFSDKKNQEKGLELGANDFFVKSEMTIRKLLEMVEKLMLAKQYWANGKPN
ncbi:response regulator [Candidatus Peregrinibacteria bacterium]|jgi:DNA-binding response OmpR family regulator|nr:response regulator [Candidatus Peregrinibacteria bacterium]MBT3598675.1 response regulator [Candidatus Peregrinibacteria bacterium]MBT4367615.1 response regulator [Candidatus Peregrinibacteria bacterium]MBT4585340.1 response regulator [Candidatus Peregrinibacteria bacterium]MBT6730835.1 response regulator [Candidatus Peregrinibacteria bacterium]